MRQAIPPTTIHAPEQLGAILRDQRRALKLTQAQAAIRLGVGQSRFSVLEQDPAEINLGRLLVLVKTLGMELVVRAQDAAPNSDLGENW